MLKKLISLVITITFLQGCKTTHFASDINNYQANNKEYGLVVVSTTINTGEIPQINSMTIKSTNAENFDKHLLVNTINDASQKTSLFFGALPPGQYKITKISAKTPAGQKYLALDDSPFLGSFIVHAGKISDLGRLILTSVNNRVALGRSELLQNNDALMERFFSDKQILKSEKLSQAWFRTRHKNDIVERFALTHPHGFSSLSELEDGQMIAGTNFGITLIRSREGRWSALARNKNLNQITVTAPYEHNGSIAVVADEFADLYEITSKGNIKPINKGNLPDGNIDFISSNNDFSLWFIAVERNGFVELYKSKTLANGIWKFQKRVEVNYDQFDGVVPKFYWRSPNGIGFATKSSSIVSCYDYSSNRWTESSTPEQRPVRSISTTSANNYIGLLTSSSGRLGGLWAQTHISKDCGKSWVEIDSPYSSKSHAPFVVEENFILEAGGLISDEGIYASKDNGKTWYKASNDEVLLNTLLLTKQHGLFSISNKTYSFEVIRSSKDYGATWQLELSTYDKSINTGD